MYEIGMYACKYIYIYTKVLKSNQNTHYICTYICYKNVYMRLRKCVNVKLGEATKRNVWKMHCGKYINMNICICIHTNICIYGTVCVY